MTDKFGLSIYTYVILAIGGLAVYLLLPRGPASENKAVRWAGAALAALSALLTVAYFGDRLANFSNGTAFYLMAGLSVASAVMTITSRNPVYSALWFALVLLSNSGLYLLQGAEFLAAATIIIYAGAIIVTFLFVIMLAQPRGSSIYDRHSREPEFACIAGVILSATLIGTLHYVTTTESAASVESLADGTRPSGSALPDARIVQRVIAEGTATNVIHPDQPFSHVQELGRTLFEDHYVSVEIIGVLLLLAVAGAVLIVGQTTTAAGGRSVPPKP